MPPPPTILAENSKGSRADYAHTLKLALLGFLGLPTVLRTNGFVPTLAFIADGGLPVVCRRGYGAHGAATTAAFCARTTTLRRA